MSFQRPAGRRAPASEPDWLTLGQAAKFLGVAIVYRKPQVWGWVLVGDVTADLAAFALKAPIPRERPRVHALVPRPHDHAFPSGHAATSFACATILAAAAPRLRVPLFVLAALIAWSRVYVGVHYPLDVVAGAALGLLVATALRLLPAALRRSRRAPRAG